MEMEISEISEENKKESKAERKKIKDLIAVVILLSGILLGSLFVDIAHLFSGVGCTLSRLSGADVFFDGKKTWVAYAEPVVKVRVFSDETCEECRSDEILLWMRKILPTILTQKIDVNSPEGRKMVGDFGIKTLPAFVFSSEVEKTEFFLQAAEIFEKQGESYIFKTSDAGVPVGKYIVLPEIKSDDVKIGSDEASVKIIEFGDAQCPFCKSMHPIIEKILGEYGDKVQYVYKNFPLDFHFQAENAALAGMCAHEQGKFLEYVGKIFEKQTEWGESSGTQKFKNYASQLSLSRLQFDQCLDDKKYADKVKKDFEEGREFGISGTPAIFVNSQFKNGVLSYDELKKLIDKEIEK